MLENYFFSKIDILGTYLVVSDIVILLSTIIFLCFYLLLLTHNYNYVLNIGNSCFIICILIFTFILFSLYEELIVLINSSYNVSTIELQIFSLNITSTTVHNYITILFKVFFLCIFYLLILLLINEHVNKLKHVNISLFTCLSLLMLSSSFIIISSSNLVLVLLLLELQSFVLLTSFYLFSTKKLNTWDLLKFEGSIKFFIMNALGSIMLFLGTGILYFITGSVMVYNIEKILLFPVNITFLSLSSILLIIGFWIKLGLFPFHQWTIDIAVSLPYFLIYYFFSLPKLIYFYLFTFLFYPILHIILPNNLEIIYFLLLILTSVCSGVLLMFESHLKRLLAFTNLASTSTALLCVFSSGDLLSTLVSTIYLFVSIILLGFLLYTLSIYKKFSYVNKTYVFNEEINNIDELMSVSYLFSRIQLITITLMLSIGGLPPFIGFYSKFYVFFNLCKISINPIYLVIFFVGTLLITFLFIKLTRLISTIFNQYYINMFKYIYKFNVRNILILFFINLYFSIELFYLILL